MEIFRWFYTDGHGNEYMTFSQCSLSHDWVLISTVILSLIVLVYYTLIAKEAYVKSKKHPKSLTKTYLTSMATMFVFCGLVGYGYTILSVWVNPYKLRVLLLIILVIWTYKFYKSLKITNTIERVLNLEKKMQNRLSGYNKMALKFQNEQQKTITYNELKSFKMYEWIVIDNIKFMKINEFDNKLVFLTEMLDDAKFGKHSHDCFETVKVIKGELIDDMNGVTLTDGESFTYGPGVVHEPYCKINSTYKVTFYT